MPECVTAPTATHKAPGPGMGLLRELWDSSARLLLSLVTMRAGTGGGLVWAGL